MSEAGIDRSPARLSSAVAVVGGLAAALIGANSLGVPLAIGGLAALLLGVLRAERNLVTLGAGGLLIAVFVAGVGASSPFLPVAGVVATLLAWDAGGTAIDVGRQLGRETPTEEIEAVHLGTTAALGIGAGALGVGVYRFVADGGPFAALFFLAIAAILLSFAAEYVN